MSNRNVNRLIDKTRFRTYKKVKKPVQERFQQLTDKQLKTIVDNRIHDKIITNRRKRIYQLKIFSRFPNAYFTDIYDNLPNHTPRYWQLFINTNTRYAVAYPLDSKTKEAIHNNLKQFVPSYHPRKITSDEEAGLVAKINTDYLSNNKCGLFVVQERNHSTLGIIDRFIRTLRDMNTPQEEPLTAQSMDEEFKYISPTKMNEMLYWYNNTVHSSTGYTPQEMMNNQELEKEYIKKCLTNQTRQLGIKDFVLNKGDYVRIINLPNSFEKKRFNISRESYKIEDRLGNIYTLIAADGSTRNVPRWLLFPVKPNENKRFGKTLGTDRGIVEKVLEKVSDNRVKVRFKMPDGSNYEKVINTRELRMPYPQIKSKWERFNN